MEVASPLLLLLFVCSLACLYNSAADARVFPPKRYRIAPRRAKVKEAPQLDTRSVRHVLGPHMQQLGKIKLQDSSGGNFENFIPKKFSGIIPFYTSPAINRLLSKIKKTSHH